MKRLVSGIVFGVIALALSQHPAASQQKSDVTLRVANYGGAFTEQSQKFVAELFTQRTGIKIEYVNANPSDHFSKMVASKGREPPYDAVLLDDNVQAEAINAGVLEKFTEHEVPNLKFVYDEVKNKHGYGPAIALYSVGIAYNKDKFKAAGLAPPTSWADLWKPEYAGHVGVPTLDNTMGHVILVVAEKLNGGNENTPEKGIDKIATIKAQSYPNSSAGITTLMTSGDVWVTPWMNGRTWGLIDKGQPLAYVLPKEGGYFGVTTLDVAAGTKHRKEVLMYINATLDPLAQLGMANMLPYGPVNKLLADLLAAYPEMAAKFPSSPEDIKKLNEIDWAAFNKNYPKAQSLWNRQVTSK